MLRIRSVRFVAVSSDIRRATPYGRPDEPTLRGHSGTPEASSGVLKRVRSQCQRAGLARGIGARLRVGGAVRADGKAGLTACGLHLFDRLGDKLRRRVITDRVT